MNYYSTEAIKIDSPIEFNDAIKFLHQELNKINFDLYDS